MVLRMRLSRFPSLALLAGFLAIVGPAVPGPSATATTLSGAIHFSSDSAGAPFGGQIWNTHGGDFIFNLYFSTTSDGSTPFLNSGDGAAASINIPLAAGTTTLFM